MRLAATSTVIAGVLATAALASPLASARPELNPPTSHARSSATAPADLPNPDQHPSTPHPTATLSAVALAGPAAASQLPGPPTWPTNPQPITPYASQLPGPTGGTVGRAALLRSLAQQERQRVAALSAYRQGQLATALGIAATAANKASAPQAIVRVHAPQSDFDWGDAGIGAAGGLIIALLIIGGAVLVTRHRQPNPHRAKVLA